MQQKLEFTWYNLIYIQKKSAKSESKMQYKFPDYLQAIYTSIHHWLDKREDAAGFRTAAVNLDSLDIRGVGTLFHRYFPTHYFKVRKSVKDDVLATWIQDNGKICIIDVGCGSGAASSAFIEAIRDFIIDYNITHPVRVHLIGVDPVKAALEIYRAVLNRIKRDKSSLPAELKITYEILCGEILDEALELQKMLQKLRRDWEQPSIPQTILLQSNILRPLANQMRDVSKAYHQIFTSTPMDRLLSLTTGTQDQKEAVQEMKSCIEQKFHKHFVDSSICDYKCDFVNPVSSFFRLEGHDDYCNMAFSAAFAAIQSVEWRNDETWLKIVDHENLFLAWAGARTVLLRESLVDEAEIKLFDHNVPKFISRLQRRLITYAEDIFHPQDHISYELPKNADSFRPRSLSRFEEEILSVAIIQVAGDEYAEKRNLYAFRLNQVNDSKSEFLYKFWGDGYKEYISDACRAAQSFPEGEVIQTDLSSYYTRIFQDKLIKKLASEIRVESKRVIWLLERILCKDLHPDYHDEGYGLAQGGVGSGYYANVYLADIDDYFLNENQWNAKYHRYADDMIIVVPKKEDVDDIVANLDKQLATLKLKRSIEKTNIIPCANFDIPNFSPGLDELNLKFNTALKALWVVACHYCQQLKICPDTLYDFMEDYQQRLRALGIAIPIPMLRRRLIKYRNLSPAKHSLSLRIRCPEFGEQNQAQDWADSFTKLNLQWIYQVDSLRNQFERIVIEILHSGKNNHDSMSREDNKRLRFSINRLCRIGMGEQVVQLIAELLQYAPEKLREPAFVIESLSIQGNDRIIRDLYTYYTQAAKEKIYMRAILLRAMRHFLSIPVDLLINVIVDQHEDAAVRLMASETVLAKKIVSLDDQHWAKIINTLSNKSLIPRLKKNLILLMRQISDCDYQTFEPLPGDDQILFDAFEIEEGMSIFEQLEPPELMNYSDSDYPDDAYEYGELMTVISY